MTSLTIQQLENLPLSIFRPKEYLLSLFRKEIRVDGRNFNERRNLQITKQVIPPKTMIIQPFQAKESLSWVMSAAQASLGDTIVYCAITGTIVTSTASVGIIECNVALNHFYPFLKAELIDNKPPVAKELEQFILDVFVRGKSIDLMQLNLLENEAVLKLGIQLTILSQNGNLKDTCYHATVAALQNVLLPSIQILPPSMADGVKNTVQPTQILLSYDSPRRLAVVLGIPLTLGIFNYGESSLSSRSPEEVFLVQDPSAREEAESDGMISIVYEPLADRWLYLSMAVNGLSQSFLLSLFAKETTALKQQFPAYQQQILS